LKFAGHIQAELFEATDRAEIAANVMPGFSRLGYGNDTAGGRLHKPEKCAAVQRR